MSRTKTATERYMVYVFVYQNMKRGQTAFNDSTTDVDIDHIIANSE